MARKSKPRLRPCPFCGGKARTEKIMCMSIPMWKVGCVGLMKELAADCPGNRRRQNITFAYHTEEQAIAAWNKRAGKVEG